jgi:hypothetical protein
LRKTAAGGGGGGGGVDGAAGETQGEKLEHIRLNEPRCTFAMTGVLCLLAYQQTPLKITAFLDVLSCSLIYV